MPSPWARRLANDNPHTYRCDTCPFATSDEQAKRGHEQYHVANPRGWLGRGEAHVMRRTTPA